MEDIHISYDINEEAFIDAYLKAHGDPQLAFDLLSTELQEYLLFDAEKLRYFKVVCSSRYQYIIDW